MKTKIGGDRIGSGQKSEIVTQHFDRSSHDISGLWRSSMAAGTLVPFMAELALPGDVHDINLACEVLTLPTLGPLFGSYKVQLDVFQIPIRLYNKALTMNKLDIGNHMEEVKIPQLKVYAEWISQEQQTFDDNEQIHSSCLLKYLGIRGIGSIIGQGAAGAKVREFNACKLLSYWDIYKNFYANKTEERGYAIHTGTLNASEIVYAHIFNGTTYVADILDSPTQYTSGPTTELIIRYEQTSLEPDPTKVLLKRDGLEAGLNEIFTNIEWDSDNPRLICKEYVGTGGLAEWLVDQQITESNQEATGIQVKEFPLSNIDTMREQIMEWPFASGTFIIDETTIEPYNFTSSKLTKDGINSRACQYSQESLALKTYQSDLFNNWISTEWIDGANGVNEVTKVSTVGDSFSIDSLNLAKKVYKMLNRIAVSGGTYDNWLDAVYDQDRITTAQTPIYHGSLIKQLAFQEVISNSESVNLDDQGTLENGAPLGTLAGRGQLTGKHKGGRMTIKSDEPNYIMGLISLTPLIDYSQGNKWDNNLKTYNDFHKPDLDAIGYQDLITDQIAWQDTQIDPDTGDITYRSAGKQPSWINYMTNVNEVYGNFAEESKEMFMTLNRRYDISAKDGKIEDMTTYIDPSKFNFIFAEQRLDAQNFWVHISKKITARRKMSAKQIPNL